MIKNQILKEVKVRTSKAVAQYWATRIAQQKKQQLDGRADQGFRGAVTGGAQMDGFIQLFVDLIGDSGLPLEFIHRKKSIELPGFFRPTKEWDFLVIKDGTLVAVIEAKSQVGPSFGNNFNNRTEEALGSSLDLWTAYREGARLLFHVGGLSLFEQTSKSKRTAFQGISRVHRCFLQEEI